MTSTAHASALCPTCHRPLVQDQRGTVCSNCGWAVVFNDHGDWFMACYRGKADEAEIERLGEMLHFWNGRSDTG